MSGVKQNLELVLSVLQADCSNQSASMMMMTMIMMIYVDGDDEDVSRRLWHNNRPTIQLTFDIALLTESSEVPLHASAAQMQWTCPKSFFKQMLSRMRLKPMLLATMMMMMIMMILILLV